MKQLQSIGISLVSLHAFMKTLMSNILEAYKAQVDCLKYSESDSYDKSHMKEKVNGLVRVHEVMQERLKTASHPEQIQILILVPNKWSRMYCSEYFNAFEYLVWTLHEITTETLHLVTNVYEDNNFSR